MPFPLRQVFLFFKPVPDSVPGVSVSVLLVPVFPFFSFPPFRFSVPAFSVSVFFTENDAQDLFCFGGHLCLIADSEAGNENYFPV